MLWVGAKAGLDVLAELPELSAVFDDALPFLGVQLVMMAVVLIATMAVLLQYALWRSSATVSKFNDGSRAPRLLVNGWLQLVVAACTAIGVSLVSALFVMHLLSLSYSDYQLGQMMMESNKYAISILVPAGGLILLLIPKLRPALDMLLDVVNHFYFRPELAIVSHSQGTMVAVEILNDEELSWINNSFSSVSLVTMGSPLSHVYQHYFKHVYPPLDQPYWVSLRRRIDRWTNICRIDDFVGNDISFPKNQSTGEEAGGAQIDFSNHAVGVGGHTNYWSDLEVLEILRPLLLEVSQSQVGSTVNFKRAA